jgi:hypothetical protein
VAKVFVLWQGLRNLGRRRRGISLQLNILVFSREPALPALGIGTIRARMKADLRRDGALSHSEGQLGSFDQLMQAEEAGTKDTAPSQYGFRQPLGAHVGEEPCGEAD